MKIEDSFRVSASPGTVWAAITDPAIVGPCIPGCEEIQVIDDTRYKARVRIAVGPISASFVLEVEVTELVPPDRVSSVTRGEEGGRASTLKAESELQLRALADGGTEISYSSEVSLVGRLGRFGLGMVKKKAASLGQRFAEAFQSRLNDEAVA